MIKVKAIVITKYISFLSWYFWMLGGLNHQVYLGLIFHCSYPTQRNQIQTIFTSQLFVWLI